MRRDLGSCLPRLAELRASSILQADSWGRRNDAQPPGDRDCSHTRHLRDGLDGLVLSIGREEDEGTLHEMGVRDG